MSSSVLAHLVVFVLLDAALLTLWALGWALPRRPRGTTLLVVQVRLEATGAPV